MKHNGYICAGKEYCTLEKHVPAPYFRKDFMVTGKVKQALLQITGLGFYELHVNGGNITKGYLAPYRSNPEDLVYFDSYDITDRLIPGKNIIAVLLGNGMQNALGAYVWDFDKAPWRSSPKLCFELNIEYANGDTETVVSDTTVKTAPSPILFDDLHYGEYYDARLETAGWDEPEFDDSAWQTALTAQTPNGEVRRCEAEPIVKREERRPVSVTPCDEGYVYDFGLNNAGLCRLHIKNSKAGQKIWLGYFEMLKDGKPFFDNIRFNRDGNIDHYQEDIYYCAGKETETYTPHFTYHGFRYVYVTGITAEQAVPELLTYLVMSSDIRQIGSFICDDDTVNRLQEATVQSDLSNFYYFPTDCPQREKNGWTADAALSSEQMLLNLTPERSYREWMRNIYKAINEKGQLPGIIPTTGWGFDWGNGPAWDNVIVYLPYYTYLYRGDTAILKELSQPLMRYLRYLESRLDENDLIAIGLGDWCQVGQTNGTPDTPLIVTDSILTADIAKKAAFIYGVLGAEKEQQYAKAFENRITAAVKKHLIDHDTRIVKGNTQTAQAMALYYGMFEETERKEAFARLLEMIDKNDGHMKVGVLGGRVLFRVLADNGCTELALEMITRRDYPSYGNWIEMGATTLWENFFLSPDGYPVESLNHHFWGDISAWFYIYLAGIRINPAGHDAREVNIAPCFVEKLNHVKADHVMPAGHLSVEWTRTEKNIQLQISVPETVHGMIKLPNGYEFSDNKQECVLASGVYQIEKINH